MRRPWIKYVYYIVVILIGILFFTYHIEQQNSRLPLLYKNQINKEYIGVVSKKFIDRKNHNNRIIVLRRLSTNQITNWSADRSGFFEFVNQGDSIVKNSGSEQINIFRDGLFLISFQMDWNIN